MVAMALTAVNTVGSMMAQNQVQQERDAAVARAQQIAREEEARQAQMRKEAQQLNERTVQKHTADSYDQGLQQEAARLEQAYQPSGTQTSLADTMLSGQSLGTDVVKEDAARQISDAVNASKKRAAALAKVSAYGNVDAGRGMLRKDTGNQLGVFGSMRRGGLQASQFGQNQIMSALPTFKPSGFSNLLSAASSLASFGAGLSAAGGAAGAGGLGNMMITDPAGYMVNLPGTMAGAGTKLADKVGLAGLIPTRW
jgi:hypothetical protein